MWYDGKKRLSFFGGHPVSITKLTCNEIFGTLNPNRQSPYLVCEKTDGVRYLLIVAKVKASELIREMVPGEEAPHTEGLGALRSLRRPCLRRGDGRDGRVVQAIPAGEALV